VANCSTSEAPQQRGQASVELIAAIPVIILCALVAAQLALVGYALWSAGSAARVGARAGYVGRDPGQAARRALPGALRERTRVSAGDSVRVRVRAPSLVPGLPRVPIDGRAALGTVEAGGG
jgi:hypothetical protein